MTDQAFAVTYTVHSVNRSAPVAVNATLPDGTPIEAFVPGCVLELVASDSGAAHSFPLRGESPLAAGDVVDAVFTKRAEAPASEG